MAKKHYLLNRYAYVAKQKGLYDGDSKETFLNDEYHRRQESTSAVMIDFEISPFSSIQQIRLSHLRFPLFYILLPDHLRMIKYIVNASKRIDYLQNQLPDVAKRRMILSQMINEMQSSNDIEGVKSTRKELQEAIEAQDTLKDVRFKNSVHRYLSTIFSTKPDIERIEDFRDLYDDLVLEEIDAKDHPDGVLFRKNPVFVTDMMKGLRVHAGSSDEQEIIQDLNRLILYMNHDAESDIIKAIISHYIFEYIHPFYDGNGRLGRYILSSYLSYKLDPLSALSISESIKARKREYGKIFEEVSNPDNRGELTLFVSGMLQMIIAGQKTVKLILDESITKMAQIYDYVYQQDFDQQEQDIILMMLQNSQFGFPSSQVTNMEIEKALIESGKKYSRRKIDRALEDLARKGYVYKVSKNPLAYRLRYGK